MNDLVTVIIPYFNDEKNIRKAINSVINQTYKKIEIILIDDENSDKSKKIFKNIKLVNKKIRIFKTKKNKGVALSRNIGIKKAKGKFIAFLDSDDLWKKNKIREQLRIIRKKKLDVCYTNYKAVKDNKIIYEVSSPKLLKFKNLLEECPICCSSTIVKSKILKNNNFKNLITKEDYLLWLLLSKKKFKFGGVNKFLTFYQIKSNSLSSLQINKLLSAFLIYNKYLKLNVILSIYFVLRLYINAFKKKFI